MSIIKSIRKFIAKDCKHILEGYNIILEDMSRSERADFVKACSRNILNMLVYPDPLKYHYHQEWVIEQLYGSALCRTARLVNSVSTLITALNEAEAILSKAGMEQGVMSTPITDRFTIDRRWFNHDDSEPEMIVSIWDDVKCATFSKQYKLVELSLP